jgi:T4 gene Gp59 loader of gp41 DNA helicase/T4 gene Gp59 loader of gp41 DNA helicase C-term
MKLTGYETYCLYLALKNHFTKDNYDFFKYGGKARNVSKESFLSRKDRFQFEKLARRCDDVKTHMVANFMADNRTWIGEMLDDEAFDATKRHLKRIQSMSYNFKNELENIDNIKELFAMTDTGYPKFMVEYNFGTLSMESIVILDAFIGFISKFDAKLGDDYLWSKFSFKARKFAPFLLQSLDKKKFKQILKERIENTIYS